MSMRYPGGLLTAATPVNAQYPSGVWTQAQTIPYVQQNVWQRDVYWPYTTLLLHGDGTNGAQNNTFLDSSTNNFTITRNGNTTQGSFTPFQQDGYWSNYFDGSGDYLTATYSAGTMDFTGDFTVECWAYRLDDGTGTFRGIVSISDASDDGFVLQDNRVFLRDINGNDFADINFTMTDNIWTHIVAVRSGSNFSIYLNGTRAGTDASASGTVESTTDTSLYIGRRLSSAGNGYFYGYISSVRIVKGTAVYDPTQSTLTVPTTPLTAIANTSLLTCQSNRFKDNSANAFAITANGNTAVQAFQPFPGFTTWSASVLGGSGYFDGSGDYLTAPNNSATDLGSADFTVEAWIYTNSANAYQGIIQKYYGPSNYNGWAFRFDNTGKIQFYCADGSSSEFTVTGTSTCNNNAWHHVAAVRSGSTIAIYVDGVRENTGTCSFTISSTSSVYIGQHFNGAFVYTGYITALRVVKGSAVYSGTTYTVPTTPPTAITNTSLLLNFTNAGIFDNAQMNNLETVGNAQVSTSVVKYGTGSMAFDGSGDYLSVAHNSALSVLGGSFTMECWFYLTSAQRDAGLISKHDGSGGYILRLDTTFIRFFTSAATADRTYSFSANTWYHVAVVSSGTTGTLYINGVAQGATFSTNGTNAASAVQIGRTNTITNDFPGYIDDLRITKGAARYITNFTPPIARMPNQ